MTGVGLVALVAALVLVLVGLWRLVAEWWDMAVTSRQEAWSIGYGARQPRARLRARCHPPCWWWWVAMWFVPERCREVPAPTDPSRVMLRQVALVHRHLYLQQFASSEEPEWMHSHQWRWMFALGLWGGYVERRLVGWGRLTTHAAAQRLRAREAPYCYAMSSAVVHHVQHPEPGHTSLFLGLWRDDDLKHYYPTNCGVRWEDHIERMVKRI